MNPAAIPQTSHEKRPVPGVAVADAAPSLPKGPTTWTKATDARDAFSVRAASSADVAFRRAAAESAPPSPSSEGRKDNLFKKYPIQGFYTTRAGVEVDAPFHLYDGSGAGILGTAKASVVQKLLAGSGHEPVLTPSGEAVVSLSAMTYSDSSAGAYEELILQIPVTRKPTTLAGDSPWHLLSTVASPDTVTMFAVRLVLNNQVAIDFGREYMGLHKEPRPGKADMCFADGRLVFDFKDGEGKSIVKGELPTKPTLAQRASALFGPMRGLGAGRAMRLMFKTIAKRDSEQVLLTRHPETGALLANPGHGKGAIVPIPSAKGVELQFGDSKLGRILASLNFEPQATVLGSKLRIAYERPRQVQA